MTIRKLLCMASVALIAWTGLYAFDYSPHMYNARVYRVALGSGTAPTAADVSALNAHNGDMVLNTDDNVLYIMHASNVYTKVTAAGALTPTSLEATTFSGKMTINAELEVNNGDVDINMTLPANKITIDQTNTTGTASTPMMKCVSKRTGDTANEASEAFLYIDDDGAYAITVADGIVQIEGEIDTAANDITLDPAGGNVIVDGIVDADSYTANAASGLDVKTAGALPLGAATASSVDISKSGAMTTVKGTLNVDEAVTLDSTLAVAGVGTFSGTQLRGVDYSDTQTVFDAVITGANRGRLSVFKDLLSGYGGIGGLIIYTNTAAILTVNTTTKTMVMDGDIDATTFDGDGADITGLSAANLTAGGVLSAVDASGVTNIGNSAIAASAGIVATKLSSGVQASLAKADASAAETNLYGSAAVTVATLPIDCVIATNSIAAKDVSGAYTLAGYSVMRVWLSSAAAGAVVATGTVAFTSGHILQTVEANGDYWIATTNTGTAGCTVDITAAADLTHYINVSVGPRITSAAMAFTKTP